MDALAQLGIDFRSILIYIINFGLLYGVLYYLAFKPLLGFIDTRRNKIATEIDQANALKEGFEKQIGLLEKEKEAVRADLQEQMQKMEALLDKKRAEMVAKMEAEREEMLAKTSAEITEHKDRMVAEVEKQLLSLMQKIVLEIVHHKVPEDVIQASINEAWKTHYRK